MVDLISTEFKESLFDSKSKNVYEKWMRRYTDFKMQKSLEGDEINVYLEFIKEISINYKCSTVWQAASCVNKFLKIYKNQDHIRNPIFKSYMKNIAKQYVPKKSAVLTVDDVNNYIRQSGKTNQDLCEKVILIIGIYGALRLSEIAYLDFKDIRKDGPNFMILIRQSKTDQAGIGSEFAISPLSSVDICPVTLLISYLNLFPIKQGRLFRKMNKLDQPTQQVLGINKIATLPKKVADFLGLTGDYSGHCFRRSAATIIADSGASMLQIKRLGRWQSSSVAESYISQSKSSKLEISSMFGKNGENHSSAVDMPQFQSCTFNNSIINININ